MYHIGVSAHLGMGMATTLLDRGAPTCRSAYGDGKVEMAWSALPRKVVSKHVDM